MTLPNPSNAARALQKLSAEAIAGTPAARIRASKAGSSVSAEEAHKRAVKAGSSVSKKAAQERARKAAAARWGKKDGLLQAKDVPLLKDSKFKPWKP